MGDDFRAYQSARDASTALLGSGAFVLVTTFIVGNAWTLGGSVAMLRAGGFFARRAKRLRPR